MKVFTTLVIKAIEIATLYEILFQISEKMKFSQLKALKKIKIINC